MDALEFGDNIYHSICVQLRRPNILPFEFRITFAFVLIFSDTTHTHNTFIVGKSLKFHACIDFNPFKNPQDTTV